MKYSIIDDKKNGNEIKSSPQQDNFLTINPEWTFDDIVLNQQVRDTLDDAISFYQNKDMILDEYKMKRFLKSSGGSLAMNFYGPSGTGKSITAEAFSNAIGRKIIKVDYSEITGNLFGDTEKNLSKLFKQAEKENLTVFFDEADALLSKRVSNDLANANSSNQIKSHLLNLLDRNNMVIIFATNFFKNYDQAFFRRILFHIGFEMPDIKQRKQIWEFHLDNAVPKKITYDDLANLTNDFAGGDIRNLALKLCIKLTSKKIKSIDKTTLELEIEKYKQAIKASNTQRIDDSIESKDIQLIDNSNNNSN